MRVSGEGIGQDKKKVWGLIPSVRQTSQFHTGTWNTDQGWINAMQWQDAIAAREGKWSADYPTSGQTLK